jgi:hypothetical protein
MHHMTSSNCTVYKGVETYYATHTQLLNTMDKTTTVHRGRDFGTGVTSEQRQENEMKSTTASGELRGRYQGTGVPKHMEGELDDKTQLRGSKDEWPAQDSQGKEDK